MDDQQCREFVSKFADGTPLEPEHFRAALNANLIFVNDGNWALTEFGRSFLPLPPGDSAACPDDDSYLPPKNPLDMVNQPPHYTAGTIECIDAIRAALTPEEFRGFCKGNAIKYSWREKLKGGDEDLKKAAWYLAKVTA